MARRRIFRVLPFCIVIIGTTLPDIGWLFFLLGWQETPYLPIHSMALVPILLVVGLSSGIGLLAITIKRELVLRRF